MTPKATKQSPGPPKRTLLWVLAGLVLAVGGGFAVWKYISNPPKPWLIRWRVTRYLKKESDRSDFTIEFAFPSKIEMAKAPPKISSDPEALTKGKLTGKDFDTLKGEYIKLETDVLAFERKVAQIESDFKDKKTQLDDVLKQLAEAQTGTDAANVSFLQSKSEYLRERMAALRKKISDQPELTARQEALAPILADLWDFQRVWLAAVDGADGSVSRLAKARTFLISDLRQKIEEAGSYADIYRAIGQELWVAERLFSSANPDHRRIGISLALQASQSAQEDAQNGWLAGRICEGYILPHLDLADNRNRRSAVNADNLIGECASIFRRNDEWQNVAKLYQMLLAKASTPLAADSARAQIGMALEQAGDAKGALQYLRAIKATNDFRAALRRIPRLEKQVKGS